jgi:Ca2+-binding RTX toxin-like protein
MATNYVTADTIGTGVRRNVTGSDALVVMAGFTVGSTDTNAIVASGIGNTVEVFGSVFAANFGISTGLTVITNAATDRVIVHSGGSVWGEQRGLDCSGFITEILNGGVIGSLGSGIRAGSGTQTFITNLASGEIDGGDQAISLVMNINARAVIDNAGSITGGTRAIFINCFDTAAVTIFNTGTIAARIGREGVAIFTDSAPETITIVNEGRIRGDVILSASRDSIDTAKGEIAGQVFLLGGADRYTGGSAADSVAGGGGKDVLAGGAGADAFIYATASEGRDRITDWKTIDRFEIDASGFGAGLTTGALAASRFRARADNQAQDANDRFIFRTGDETLWFDANGSAAGRLKLIADLQDGARVTAADILLV